MVRDERPVMLERLALLDRPAKCAVKARFLESTLHFSVVRLKLS